MRHSDLLKLTMNVYTDPKLLDVHGALNSLPSLDLDTERKATPNILSATGAESNRPRTVAPTVAPTAYKSGHLESFRVKTADTGPQRILKLADDENPCKSSEKALAAGVANKAFGIGMTGFEPAASTSRT